MLERTAIGLKSLIDWEAARQDAIEAARVGRQDLGYLVKHFGSGALLEVSPSVAQHYLQFSVGKDSFRKILFSDLNIKPLKDKRRHHVQVSSAMIPWIFSIEKALLLEHEAPRSMLTIADWQRVTVFFSRFAYREATEDLIRLLSNDIRFPQNLIDPKVTPISQDVVGTEVKTNDIPIDIPGGWQDISCHNFWVNVETYQVERIEQVFPAYRPVALGAAIALKKIARNNPQLRPSIEPALREFDATPKPCSVFVTGKEIEGTRKPSGGYYAD